MNLQAILAPIVRVFEGSRIPYAVIGGYAVAAWGEMRATRDVDLYCLVSDLPQLKLALKGAGIAFEHRTGDLDDPISDVVRIDIGFPEKLYEVDVLAGIRGAPVGLLQRSRSVAFQDMELRVAGPEDLIVLKLLGGSPLDIEDARGILHVQETAIDLRLLREICPDHLHEVLESLLS